MNYQVVDQAFLSQLKQHANNNHANVMAANTTGGSSKERSGRMAVGGGKAAKSSTTASGGGTHQQHGTRNPTGTSQIASGSSMNNTGNLFEFMSV